MRPDRIVVGADDEQAINLMRALYAPFQRNHEKLVIMDVRSAELTKYAANAMLATRISFMNELAVLAEKLGADIELVRQGIGSDPRIGWHFLYAGCGYGGSCFPKDVKALIRTAADAGRRLKVLQAVEDANEDQKLLLVEKVVARFGENLSGKHFALWGLAFKPNTDDMREAPSRVIIQELFERGATVTAYDPVAMDEAKRIFGDEPRLQYATRPMQALHNADALLIVTEWKEFRSPDFDVMAKELRSPVVLTGATYLILSCHVRQGLNIHLSEGNEQWLRFLLPAEPGFWARIYVSACLTQTTMCCVWIIILRGQSAILRTFWITPASR
jgi:UDPglucose 6-dehydrogenase